MGSKCELTPELCKVLTVLGSGTTKPAKSERMQALACAKHDGLRFLLPQIYLGLQPYPLKHHQSYCLMSQYLMFRSTISNLNQKMEAMQVANTLMKDMVENTKSSVVQLQLENSMLRCESNALLEGHQRQLLVRI